METLFYYLEFPFTRYALICGVFISLASALFGVTLVLKRFSFIGDGLSHVAFGALAIATVLKISNTMFFVLPVTVLCAVVILKSGRKINGDAAIAVTSVGSLAVGYLLMNIFPSSSNVAGDVCSTLFGSASILTLSETDVWMSVILSLAVIFLFVIFYHRIFSVTFDENFASATGINASVYNLFIAVVIAVVIVIAMNLVGSLLISALVVFPALSAMRVFKTFFSVTLCAACLSVVCSLVGITVSILAATPVGATVVAADILAFAACSAVGAVFKRK